MTDTVHALTVDVEEWFHDDWRPNRGVDWDELPSTVVAEVEALLGMLDAADARATFFVLGDVVRRHPTLVRRIADAGHEIGSHGYAHVKVASQTRSEFTDDVRRARDVLGDALGTPVAGYRAPYFISSPRQLWATEVLAQLGFRYDAGYVPVRWMPYLGRDIPRAPFRHASGLWEFPLPFAEAYGGWNLPYAGGGPMFRFLPYKTIRRFLLAYAAEVGPAVVYVHPWELTPMPRALPATPRHVRLWKRLGRSRTLPNVRQLLTEFRFAPIREVYADRLAS